MAGFFDSIIVSDGTQELDPFKGALVTRILVKNNGTANATITLEGVTDQIAGGEQVEYYNPSQSFWARKIEQVTAASDGTLIVRAFA